MAAPTDERTEPLESQPSPQVEGTQEGDGGQQGSAPPPASYSDLTPEQVERLLEEREDLKRWDQSRLDRRAAAQAEAWNRQTEAQRVADARKADDERYARIGKQLQEYALGRADPPSDENQEWFASHETTRRVQEAEAKVFQMWATDYDAARGKIKELPDFREYVNRSTGDLIEAVYEAGRSSREPEIQAEAKKLAEAMTAEKMDQHRSILPNPEVARTATNGGGINTLADLLALSSTDRTAFRRDNPARYNQLAAQATNG